MRKVLGIVGQGFVYQKFKNYYNIKTYDLDKNKCNSTEQEVFDCEIVFVCLPTPMEKDGRCHTNIVNNALTELDDNGNTKIVIVKSTVPPGTVMSWNKIYMYTSNMFPYFYYCKIYSTSRNYSELE